MVLTSDFQSATSLPDPNATRPSAPTSETLEDLLAAAAQYTSLVDGVAMTLGGYRSNGGMNSGWEG